LGGEEECQVAGALEEKEVRGVPIAGSVGGGGGERGAEWRECWRRRR
jgi:hypothetical protein